MFQKGKSKYWKVIKPKQECNIPEHYGKNLGFEPVEVKALESKIGIKKVETKQMEVKKDERIAKKRRKRKRRKSK